MRLLLATALLMAAACGNAVAETTPARLDDPKVMGRPVDHCADIDATNDCSARGVARAAQKACIANGFGDEGGFHWRPASGTAMHYITEYDMHAGEVGGRWVAQSTSGTFDWIACRK